MKRAVVIGGRGKVGTYLVPMLVRDGYSVINVSRGVTQPYINDAAWLDVQQHTIDRGEPGFSGKMAGFEADVVVDMICFSGEDMLALADALSGHVGHYIACGSLWYHGRSAQPPIFEYECRDPLCEYGREKLKMDDGIISLYARRRFPGTIVHPGHIVGIGHRPINPQGNGNLEIFTKIRNGEEVPMPNLGMETLHHVHASDIAGLIMAAIHSGAVSFGQGFHAAASRAVTLRGYAEEVASWYGSEAVLNFMPVEKWRMCVSREDAEATLDHINHSPNASMEKAARLLGFTPRYSGMQAVRESLDWLIENGRVK